MIINKEEKMYPLDLFFKTSAKTNERKKVNSITATKKE